MSQTQCPLCGGPITSEHLDQITTRIRDEEQRKACQLKKSLEEEHRVHIQRETEKARQGAFAENEAVIKARLEEQKAALQAQEVLREQALKADLDQRSKSLQTALENAQNLQTQFNTLKASKDESDRLQKAAREKERENWEEERSRSEASLQCLIAEQTKALEAANAAVELLRADLQAEREAHKASKDESDKAVNLMVQEHRVVLERENEKLLAKKDNEHKREVEKWQTRLKEMSRQLEKKNANELGEPPTADLFETLKGDYPDDYVTRVKNGEAGADIHQTVKHKGEKCGLIILDSKNHAQWRHEFPKKLWDDLRAAKADYAILPSSVFPAGEKELCIRDRVIVVHPARASQIVRILRDFLIKLHMQRLSGKERNTKVEQLYRWITTDEFAQTFLEAQQLTEGLLELDVKEQKWHGKIWEDRGKMLKKLTNAHRAIDEGIYSIVGGKDSEDTDETDTSRDAEVLFQ